MDHVDLSDRLVGIGAIATRLGLSPSYVRKLERQGALPPALRVDVVGRRVWRARDIEEAAARLAERRRPQPTAA